MKAVFDTKAESAYDDDISVRYHFPRRYLDAVAATVGDWVVFRQPRADGGSKAYVAVARVDRVEPDPNLEGHHYAYVSQFLEFPRPTPWRADGRYAERALREIENVPQIGLYLRGRSVRTLEEDDFANIVAYGFDGYLPNLERPSEGPSNGSFERRYASAIVTRAVRDACFRSSVCAAYGGRCAVTGWSLRDGAGRSEAQAAHIWSVAEGGPDIVQNGLALSATVHWLFDRHLIAVSEDHRILIATSVRKDAGELVRAGTGSLQLPMDANRRPKEVFLARHRARFLERGGANG